MELSQQARELGCWAAEEMEAPVAARAPESTLRRLCLGQGADIWAYVLRHVHSQRNVKTIRGNLLWYGHQDSPEACRKLKLEAAVAHLRAEILELDQSLELLERETEAQGDPWGWIDGQQIEVKESTDGRPCSSHRHGHGAGPTEHARHPASCSPPPGPSWGHAKTAAWAPRSHAAAAESAQAFAGHRELPPPRNLSPNCTPLPRKAKVDINFGPLTSAALSLEPVVLGDVRTACSLRTQFLQKLLMPRAKGGSIPTPRDDLFGTSYQQWLSSVETLLTNHPPGHVLAALEHLAAEREAEIQSLCSVDELQDTEIASSAPILSSQAPDQPNSSQPLPSMVHLIQEGWQSVAALVTQRGPLLKDHQILTRHLQGLMEDMERCTVGSSERQALVLGIRSSALWAELKALRAMSQELEEASGQRQLLLQELQAKQQRILHWRQLVEETQEQVRLLIKGNSASKTSLCRSPGEVLALVQQKVVPTSEMVAPQSQELLRCLEEEAQHLPHLLLGTLLRHSPEGLQPLPTVLPSIHQLHPASPRGSSLIVLSHTLGLPAGKAPELLLPKAASLRQDLLFLQDQRSLRCWYLLHMKTSLPPGPSTQGGSSRGKPPSPGSSAKACPCPSGSCAGSRPKAPCSSCADEAVAQKEVQSFAFVHPNTSLPLIRLLEESIAWMHQPIVSTHTCHPPSQAVLFFLSVALPLSYHPTKAKRMGYCGPHPT
ncbi:HAUS augmin-like complex subunit 5 isoform X2 [Balaenoptera musculus]|uniref:HAUS augmin-like complex subunit 5 isoform X2 n=1 Tax=Balaenoptera musculus TaxID=9771 RepID=A0A8B8VUS6_BALMU|nr:HAUS augmin-like complex subunit 5 isoform X2 [Balaenoptera musculus]